MSSGASRTFDDRGASARDGAASGTVPHRTEIAASTLNPPCIGIARRDGTVCMGGGTAAAPTPPTYRMQADARGTLATASLSSEQRRLNPNDSADGDGGHGR
jgi:hypothetical protein